MARPVLAASEVDRLRRGSLYCDAMLTRIRTVLFVGATLVALAGCSKETTGPQVAPSTGQAGYAEEYPDQLASARGKFIEREGKARQAMSNFSAYPDELDKPSWPDVARVYALADDAGKSSRYVEAIHEAETVAGFFEDEKEEISKKVAGAASYAAKKDGCKTEGIYGPASTALEKSVEKQLEERLRKENEAHRYIEMHEEPLGKANREKLEKQADDIAYTSYLVNVGVDEEKAKLEAMVAEAEDVKKTLDRVIEENKAIAADPAKPESVKKAAQGEVDAAERAKGKIDSEIQQAQHVLGEIDNRIKALRDEYGKAFEQLEQKVEEKKKAQPAAS